MQNPFPHSTNEIKSILNVSLTRLDLPNEAKKHAILKLLNTEANKMPFYDIYLENETINNNSNEKKESKTLRPLFKSIHRTTGTKALSKQQRTFMQSSGNQEISLFEASVLSDFKKKSPHKALILSELYCDFDKEKDRKPFEKHSQTLDKENFTREIDVWERENKGVAHIKSKSLQLKKQKLPKLLPNLNKNSEFEEKYAPNKEQLFKTFNNDFYLDETLRKLLIRYTKFASDNDEEHSQGNDDGLPQTLEDFQREIQGFFALKVANGATIIEKTVFFEQNRAKIEKKIARRIRNSEAYVDNKQGNIQLFRKENSYINSKLSQIKHLIKSLHFSLMSSQNSKPPEEKPVNSKRNFRNTVFSIGSPLLNRESSVSIDLKKGNVGKFMEKNLEIMQKEKEIKDLQTNYKKFEEKLRYNKELLEVLEQENRKEKEILKEMQYIRKNFYLNLLKQGSDTGFEEGLSWIIRVLWTLGLEVLPINLPDFLDTKAKEFILQKAGLERELREFEILARVSLENYMMNSNNNLNVNANTININGDAVNESSENTKKNNSVGDKRSKNEIIYGEMKQKIKREILPKSMAITNGNLEQSSLLLRRNSVENFENSMSLFANEETVQYYSSKGDFLRGFEALQKQMQSKNVELLKEERKEITRIIKEFDYKNYSKRYYIDCDSVLAALVGATKANKELIRNGMSKKTHKT